ncbi:MAG: hypothetical protein DRH21_05870 [Deltaproteobacteria bacterium]|nr:MAG: hypothetical protein DRH21_05870 [Deltaproteobacteria bacterium]
MRKISYQALVIPTKMWGNRGACEAAVAVIFDETADGRRYLSTKGAKGHQEGLKRDLSFYPFELFVVEKQFTVIR